LARKKDMTRPKTVFPIPVGAMAAKLSPRRTLLAHTRWSVLGLLPKALSKNSKNSSIFSIGNTDFSGLLVLSQSPFLASLTVR